MKISLNVCAGHELSVLHQQLSQAASSPAVLMQDARRTPPPSCLPVALVAAPAHQNTRSTTAPGKLCTFKQFLLFAVFLYISDGICQSLSLIHI